MRNLCWISLFVFLLHGCGPVKPGGLHRLREGMPPPARITAPVFPLDSGVLFKAAIDIRKHHLSGLLLVKRVMPAGSASPSTRAVFMNEVGMTFFDLELGTDSTRIVHCFGPLNRKGFISILDASLRALTWQGLPENPLFYDQPKENRYVAAGKYRKFNAWQSYSAGRDTLVAAAVKSGPADGVSVSFGNYSGGFPSRIVIENPLTGMVMTLRKVK